MSKVLKSGWRGDTRDMTTVTKHGGFLPRYLMKQHSGGEEGFIKCTNKVDGKAGCMCDGFDEHSLFIKARHKCLAILKKPGDLQSHVIARFGGIEYVSTGTNPTEAYDREHKYKISGTFYEYTIEQALQRFRVDTKLKALDKPIKIYIDTQNIGQARLIGMVPPRSPNELSFITPVLPEFIEEV